MKKPDIKPPIRDQDVDPLIAKYLQEIGRRGGQASGAKKAESSRKNLEKARTTRHKKGNKECTD